jgi:hypothetical protein
MHLQADGVSTADETYALYEYVYHVVTADLAGGSCRGISDRFGVPGDQIMTTYDTTVPDATRALVRHCPTYLAVGSVVAVRGCQKNCDCIVRRPGVSETCESIAAAFNASPARIRPVSGGSCTCADDCPHLTPGALLYVCGENRSAPAAQQHLPPAAYFSYVVTSDDTRFRYSSTCERIAAKCGTSPTLITGSKMAPSEVCSTGGGKGGGSLVPGAPVFVGGCTTPMRNVGPVWSTMPFNVSFSSNSTFLRDLDLDLVLSHSAKEDFFTPLGMLTAGWNAALHARVGDPAAATARDVVEAQFVGFAAEGRVLQLKLQMQVAHLPVYFPVVKRSLLALAVANSSSYANSTVRGMLSGALLRDSDGNPRLPNGTLNGTADILAVALHMTVDCGDPCPPAPGYCDHGNVDSGNQNQNQGCVCVCHDGYAAASNQQPGVCSLIVVKSGLSAAVVVVAAVILLLMAASIGALVRAERQRPRKTAITPFEPDPFEDDPDETTCSVVRGKVRKCRAYFNRFLKECSLKLLMALMLASFASLIAMLILDGDLVQAIYM